MPKNNNELSLDEEKYNFCPICGARFFGEYSEHRCSERVLRAIDGAHKRDPEELTIGALQRPFNERLTEGLKLLRKYGIDAEGYSD